MDKKELPFKEAFTFETREKMSSEFAKKYPGHIPIVCEKNRRSQLKHLTSNLFAFMTLFRIILSGFFCQKTSNFFISSEKSEIQFLWMSLLLCIFLFTEKTFLNLVFFFHSFKIFTRIDSKMIEVYEQYKDHDGFLYLEYYEHSSFG